MIVKNREVMTHSLTFTAFDVNDDDWDYVIDALSVALPDFNVFFGDGHNMTFSWESERVKEIKTKCDCCDCND